MTPAFDENTLPDVGLEGFKNGYFYAIETADFQTKEDFEKLLQYMHAFAERSFRYYWEQGTPLNQYFVTAERLGVIVYGEARSSFYRHPNYERDYVHIPQSPDGTYAFDWQEDVVEKGPMFFETTLALSERERRRRDVADLAKVSDPSPLILRPALWGMGIDIPVAVRRLKSSRVARWLSRAWSRRKP
ncbi:hypothetical protein HU675_0037305 [Bradyrhizobium septentrionale]|uniref:hypothetical protein n=1 Tax=Bradyrhizobium septentrionale TaxID=1404411 RepID=UPI00159648A9|nr:hypothetical protein [Bradyrhizobium septentrionale]UGY23556.1 hypothetical protein HU675_0037305 [Bradyrhizobium septentrionale]